jgi:hypothetical protein
MSRQSTTRDMHTYVMRTEMNPYIVDTPTNNLLNPSTWFKSKETTETDGTPKLTRTEIALDKIAKKAAIENKIALEKANAKLASIQQQNESSQKRVNELAEKSRSLTKVLSHAAPQNPKSTDDDEDEPE